MANATNQIQNVKEKAKDTASNITDKAREAADKGGDLAQKAVDKVGDYANKAADKAGQMASAAGDRADDAVETVGSSMKNFAGTIRENMPNKGVIGGATDSVAGALESGGRYLEEKGLSGIGSDVTDLIKRNPVPAVLLALGLGYLIACSTRS